MQHVIKVATLNINGIVTKTRIVILEDVFRRQVIDLALLQEVTRGGLTTLLRYTAHTNIRTERRGTAFLAKHGLVLSDIRRIPSGRGIAATYNGMRIINLYVPSTAEKRKEREIFYNTEISPLLPSTHTEMLIAGDFNYVLASSDTTGRGNYSRAFDALI
jgi:exonuclease III